MHLSHPAEVMTYKSCVRLEDTPPVRSQDIRGEARIFERAFGIGSSELAETVALIGEQLDHQLQPA